MDWGRSVNYLLKVNIRIQSLYQTVTQRITSVINNIFIVKKKTKNQRTTKRPCCTNSCDLILVQARYQLADSNLGTDYFQ